MITALASVHAKVELTLKICKDSFKFQNVVRSASALKILIKFDFKWFSGVKPHSRLLAEIHERAALRRISQAHELMYRAFQLNKFRHDKYCLTYFLITIRISITSRLGCVHLTLRSLTTNKSKNRNIQSIGSVEC